jgi:two-component system, sensor histidine kinase and response regulator
MWFDLPFEPASSVAPPATTTGPVPPYKIDARVLVAEDNPVNQEVIRAMLARLGVDTTLVENGEQAVLALDRGSFDLVLLDCQMPVLDGYQAAARIRAAETGTRTPIIALTANAFADDRQRCLDAGMDDYLTKPVTIGGLAEALLRWTPTAPKTGAQSGGIDPPREAVESSAAAQAAIDVSAIAALRNSVRDDEADFVSRLVSIFLKNSREAMPDFDRAIAAGNCTVLGSLAHRMTSSSSYLGAKRLAALLAELEQAAARGDTEVCGRLAREASHEFARAERELEAYL